jgi:hypothetical protein
MEFSSPPQPGPSPAGEILGAARRPAWHGCGKARANTRMPTSCSVHRRLRYQGFAGGEGASYRIEVTPHGRIAVMRLSVANQSTQATIPTLL